MSHRATFRVDDVELGSQRFAADEAAVRAAVAATGVGGILVKSWGSSAPVFAASPMPALAGAAQLAYDSHLPLVLSPDVVWITITQGFAHHVRLHAGALQADLVRHKGKARLAVQADFIDWREDFWREAIASFTSRIGEHTGEIGSLLVCDFSTTGPVERTASQVVLMEAMESFFDYVVKPICGVPSITLEGTPDDWRRLCGKVERLGHYGLEFWTKYLSPICEQFARASAGDVDRGFWRRMVRLRHSCGGPHLEGWIGRFYPYLKDDAGVVAFRNPMVPTAEDAVRMREDWEQSRDRWRELMGDEDFTEPPAEPRYDDFGGGVDITSLPGGLSTVPVKIEYFVGERLVRLCAGLIGVGQDEATLALRPIAGWALCDESPLARVRERLQAESSDFREPLPGDDLAQALAGISWSDFVAGASATGSELVALYSITDGASIHKPPEGLPAYRILPLAEVEMILLKSPRDYAERQSMVDQWRAEGKLGDETPEMALLRITEDMPITQWMRFCVLSDGSFLAFRFESGEPAEVAHVPSAEMAAQRRGVLIADSVLECVERILDAGPTPWW